MGTSAPVRREYEIPIIEPYRLPEIPKGLPEPDPEHIVHPIVVPVRQPVEHPERVEV